MKLDMPTPSAKPIAPKPPSFSPMKPPTPEGAASARATAWAQTTPPTPPPTPPTPQEQAATDANTWAQQQPAPSVEELAQRPPTSPTAPPLATGPGRPRISSIAGAATQDERDDAHRSYTTGDDDIPTPIDPNAGTAYDAATTSPAPAPQSADQRPQDQRNSVTRGATPATTSPAPPPTAPPRPRILGAGTAYDAANVVSGGIDRLRNAGQSLLSGVSAAGESIGNAATQGIAQAKPPATTPGPSPQDQLNSVTRGATPATTSPAPAPQSADQRPHSAMWHHINSMSEDARNRYGWQRAGSGWVRNPSSNELDEMRQGYAAGESQPSNTWEAPGTISPEGEYVGPKYRTPTNTRAGGQPLVQHGRNLFARS
jgi:hypothetical protein